MWKWLSRRGHGRDAESEEAERSRIAILFDHFRRILELNNSVLDAMSSMEHALGGEYIFDRAFLDSSVRTISSLVHHVIYSLNALTRNGYVPLYDRYQDIRLVLDDILSGGPGPHAVQPVFALDELDWDLEPVAGIEAVCQAELRRHKGLPVADGFVLTVVGTRILRSKEPGFDIPDRLAASPGDIRTMIGEQVERLARELPRFERLRLRLVRAPGHDAEADPLPEIVVAVDDVAAGVERLLAGVSDGESSVAVLVHAEHEATAHGVVRTRDPEAGRLDALRIIARRAGSGSEGGDNGDAGREQDRYLVRRVYPFDPVRSRIGAREPLEHGERMPDGRRPLDTGRDKMLRGSALVDVLLQRALADTAMTLERMLGMPAELGWSQLDDGTCIVHRPRLLALPGAGEPGPELQREIREAEILCSGGATVQAGVAAGRVVHVRDDMRPEDFPPGAMAVSRSASPRLTPILQRAGALVTELGTPAGHLAAVARELRLPAVFGMDDALQRLPAGAEMTLDAAEGVAYAGVLDGLLQSGWGAELYPTDPEYHTLRRLLRFIRPLNLTDPQDGSFTPQGCRTFHDIIHYCHEKAVDELAHFQERRPGLASVRSRPLHTGLPMPIRVLDIGAGLADDAPAEPGVESVRSEPLAAFLEGLQQPGAWESASASLRLRDVFAAAPRSLAQLNAQPDSLGRNLAIAGRDYLNLSLRLGFHFSVVDAYVGPNAERNHVYFRFAGGLADPARRARRARMIRDVLHTLDFSVTFKDDLVVGSLKQVEPAEARATLRTLGVLTAFVRQRDTAMHSDGDERRFFEDFERLFLNGPTGAAETGEGTA